MNIEITVFTSFEIKKYRRSVSMGIELGSQVQVLEPKILSEKIRDEAKKMLKL